MHKNWVKMVLMDFADMGSFFQFNYRKSHNTSVIEYGKSLLSKFYSKLKGFCCYDQRDFGSHRKSKEKSLDRHGKCYR
jgi:hypothetical protein